MQSIQIARFLIDLDISLRVYKYELCSMRYSHVVYVRREANLIVCCLVRAVVKYSTKYIFLNPNCHVPNLEKLRRRNKVYLYYCRSFKVFTYPYAEMPKKKKKKKKPSSPETLQFISCNEKFFNIKLFKIKEMIIVQNFIFWTTLLSSFSHLKYLNSIRC
jgi:hypothetical protein